MLDILRWFEWIKNSNLVALITNRIEFEKYNFLTLDVNILSKIENIFQEQKNTTLKIFTWNKDFEEILFIFYLDSKKDLNPFSSCSIACGINLYGNSSVPISNKYFILATYF